MRNPERIDRITEKLTEIWKIVPDWRFGQLISNVMGSIMYDNNKQDMFFPEDVFWERELENYLKKLKGDNE